jgi:intracellular sulfur oxidation DsrE/DsrF family protein
MTRVMTLLLTAVFLLTSGTAAIANERYGKQKVVYHINYDNQKQQIGAMRNIQNHINAVGAENIEVAIVMHGNGVSLLKYAKEDADMESKVVSLKSQNVKFLVCNNTLVGRKIDYKTDLFDVYEEDIVPSGVAELSRLQAMGYTYIKP